MKFLVSVAFESVTEPATPREKSLWEERYYMVESWDAEEVRGLAESAIQNFKPTAPYLAASGHQVTHIPRFVISVEEFNEDAYARTDEGLKLSSEREVFSRYLRYSEAISLKSKFTDSDFD